MYRFRYVVWVQIILTLPILMAACGPAEAPQPPATQEAAPTPESLVAEWKQFAVDAKQNLGHPRPPEIAARLMKFGPDALDPLLAVLEDPESDPAEKVLVVSSLRTLVTPEMFPRLKKLTTTDHDETTRACALQLIALIRSPEVEPFLRGFLDDPQRRVQLTAKFSVAARGDKNVREQVIDMYRDDATTISEKVQILNVIFAKPGKADDPILLSAVADETIPAYHRVLTCAALARIGAAEALDVLRDRAANDVDLDVQKAAQEAVETIEEKLAAP